MLRAALAPLLRIKTLASTAQNSSFRPPLRIVLLCALLLCAFLPLTGCARLRPKPKETYVYVSAKSTFLRDRIAAVSNRTANVTNGQKLTVIGTARRFYHVRTEKGEEGWIDERAIVTQQVADGFQKLQADHTKDPVSATGAARDEVNVHLTPGRDTEKFYRLAEGDKLQLIARATTPKPLPPGPKPKPGPDGKPPKEEPPAMEDWWLTRDSAGHTGWLLSRMVDVDAPDAIAKYAEGQRIVGNYTLTTVEDPEIEGTDKNVPIYVTLMNSWKSGLPYDFNQVRVFTWNVKKHRYETAFRDKNIQGFLPVKIFQDPGQPGGKGISATTAPAFTYRVLSADSPPVIPDPTTGMITPGKLIEKTYRLEGNITRRVLKPGQVAQPEAKAVVEDPAKTAKTAKKKKK